MAAFWVLDWVLVVRRDVLRSVVRFWVPSGVVMSVMVSVMVSSSVVVAVLEAADCSATKSPRMVAWEAVVFCVEEVARESVVVLWVAVMWESVAVCLVVEQDEKRTTAQMVARAMVNKQMVLAMLHLVRGEAKRARMSSVILGRGTRLLLFVAFIFV